MANCFRFLDEYTRGSEFLSRALLKWANDKHMESVLSDPGKPWQNGTNESFNGKFRDDCLDMKWFRNRMEVKVIIQDWRRHYNEIRLHLSLNYCTPAEFNSGLKKAIFNCDQEVEFRLVRRIPSGHDSKRVIKTYRL